MKHIESQGFNSFISSNVKSLRAKRNYTQKQLAELCNIPRTTLTNIESGQANPSLSNVIKIANALNVSIDLLVNPPVASTILINADKVPKVIKGDTEIFKLLPEKVKGVDMDRVVLGPHETFRGTPHLNGTREYMSVIEGQVEVRLNGESYTVNRNDLLAFPGDVHHSYRNTGKNESIYISIIIPNP
jgi:transcriptional regulator with XRE-family HTH domain